MKLPSILGIRGARDKPRDSYGGSAYSFFFGRSTSGKAVNERTAMQTTAVYSCVRILAETVASLPVHLYRYTETGKERVYDHPLYRLLHDEPNPEMTSFVFRETLMSHLLIWRNAYAQIIRDENGKVLSLYPLLPDKMEADRDENGQLYYIYTRNSDENPNFEEYGRVYLRQQDVLHIPVQRLEVGSTYVDYTSLLLTSKYSIIPSVTKKIYLKGKGKAAMAKDINIQDLINKINKFREERDWRKFHNPKDLSISISLEASELLELFQWKSSEEAVENNLDRMKDEIADIFIYLLMLSDDLGLDLFSAVTEKMNKNKGKYPKELCKGKIKHNISLLHCLFENCRVNYGLI